MAYPCLLTTRQSHLPRKGPIPTRNRPTVDSHPLACRAEYSADIYSFGVVLWEMCTKEMPIRGALRDVRVPEECPASVQDIIHACMAQVTSLYMLPFESSTAEQESLL